MSIALEEIIDICPKLWYTIVTILGGANDGYLNLFSDLEQIECK